MLPPLLLLSGRPWPSADGIRYCSFRDLIEYLYYGMICHPDQEIIAVPPQQTEIIRLHGEYLAMTGDHAAAIPVLIAGAEQNPVHAGILCSIAASQMMRGDLADALPYLKQSFACAWRPDELAHAYRNQGFYQSRKGDDEGAICCYLMAMTWDDSAQGREELQLITGNTGSHTDTGYYQIHGREILSMRGIPTGPDPDMVELLIQTADRYQEEQNLLKAREYLIRAHQLLMSDELEERIRKIEWFFEDMVDF
jgi:tetratricopeptide (TPR) repeat protein